MREYYLSLIEERRQGGVAIILRGLLRACCWVYGGIVTALRWVYRQGVLRTYDLGRPVISVGNMTWGGAGKTPITEWIVHQLLAVGKKPVILMRGYMSKKKGDGHFFRREKKCPSPFLSDEAQLLNQTFGGLVPVIVNRDRVQGALRVPPNYPYDVFVLDDGFQHWRVRRDLDIVAIDTTNPFGNGAVLPRGILREPLSALKWAKVCVLTKADIGADNIPQIRHIIQERNPDAVIVETVHQPQCVYDLRSGEKFGVAHIGGRPAVLVSGIGSPFGFEQTVKNVGTDVRHHMVYPDHYCYTEKDIQDIIFQVERQGSACVLTTDKDAVKLRGLMTHVPEHIEVFVVTVKISVVKGEEDFRHAIRSVCHY